MRRISLCLPMLVFLAGCATTGTGPTSVDSSRTPPQIGEASYYASKWDGRRSASGERYDEQSLTAAHRTLPFGTRVRVTNLGNHKTVVVRINDRGPYRKGRIIDLSRAAARQLDFLADGVTQVRVEVVDSP
jgi:rare lipoprotein A